MVSFAFLETCDETSCSTERDASRKWEDDGEQSKGLGDGKRKIANLGIGVATVDIYQWIDFVGIEKLQRWATYPATAVRALTD